MADLERFFQQRHLLAHRDGFVDQDYIDRTDDVACSVGQRLVIWEQSIIQLAGLIEKLGSALIQDVSP